MPTLNNPFDPALRPVFSVQPHVLVSKSNSRDLFFALIQGGSNQMDVLARAYCHLTQQLRGIEQCYGEQFVNVYQPERIAQLSAASPIMESIDYQNISHYAPIILTEFYSLQAASQAAGSQSPIAVDLMAVYLKLTGRESYLPVFEGVMTMSCHALPTLRSLAFAAQKTIADSVFDFAVLQLIFAQHCRVFFPEMLGFSLACCKTALFSPCSDDMFIAHFVTTRQTLLDAQASVLITIIEHYIGLFPEQADSLWCRVQVGFYLYQQYAQHCQQSERQARKLSPQQAVVRLLQRLAPKTLGHHGNIKLADKSLDTWFGQTPFDGDAFLAALKNSPYINKAAPERSVLLGLFEFGGPMFGVLDHTEKSLLKAWLLSDTVTPSSVQVANSKPIQLTLPNTDTEIIPDDTKYSQLKPRELYYYLVNADVFPGVLGKARQHVNSVLWKTKYLNRLPFKHYSHQVFADYIQALYQVEVDAYLPLMGLPKMSKQAYLWGIKQFSPAILTDGCWLQHSKQLTLCTNKAIGNILFKIYCDEVGNGILAQNHPFIYQQLLESVGICVPPVHSKAFVEYSEFIDSAFDIPVYLMAISKFSIAFLPELLGLNMAIEISGLGKVYLRLAEELRFYGINPAIVNVHISIDNLATGHSSLAMQAIQLYMDDILARHGKQTVDQHWRRIYTGYCSLKSVSTAFKYGLIVNYWLKHKIGAVRGSHH